MRSLKATAKIAAKAPVAICWEIAIAALVGVALAPEAAVSEPDAADVALAVVDSELDDEAEESLELLSTVVALRVPHCWLFMQPSCPCASFGFASIHCLKVSWQM